MNNEFIITTTGSIEGGTVQQYFGVVCSNIVVGTNIFSDFAASFTDFFGGSSDTYKSKLELIYSQATKELKEKAFALGANAIIGYRIDFDEISGKDKSMFMASASGTACKIKHVSKTAEALLTSTDKNISSNVLNNEIERIMTIEQINQNKNITDENFKFLMVNPQEEILDNLLGRYIASVRDINYQKFTTLLERLLSVYPKSILINKIYDLYSKDGNELLKRLILNINMFSAKHILKIMEKDVGKAIAVIPSEAESYDQKELSYMKELLEKLKNLPDVNHIEFVKGGLLSKTSEKMICICGTKSDPELQFCPSCGRNIKGLYKNQVKILNDYEVRVKALSSLLDTN